MAKSYKLYLFDLDGTLLDSDEMIWLTFVDLYKKYKPADFVPDPKKVATFSGPPINDSLRGEFPDANFDEVLNDWRTWSRAYYQDVVSLFDGALELIQTFQEKGIKFGIVTNKHRYATDLALKVVGLDKYDIFTITADEVIDLKPNPDGVFKAMKHFGIENKEDVIYIGDGVFDYKTTLEAGIDFGFVSWSPRKFEDPSKFSLVIDSYKDFAKEF